MDVPDIKILFDDIYPTIFKTLKTIGAINKVSWFETVWFEEYYI